MNLYWNSKLKIHFQNTTFMKEYEIMNMLDHANILKTYGIFLSDEKNPPSILLEFCPQNLQKAIEDKKFTNEELVKNIYQIAEGMYPLYLYLYFDLNLKNSPYFPNSGQTLLKNNFF